MTAWTMNAEVLEPGWFEIPELSDPEVSAWSSDVARSLETSWGTEWNSDVTQQVQGELERIQRLRPEDASLALAYWPPSSDLFFGLKVVIGQAPRLEDWLEDGYELRRFEAEHMGIGVECVSVDAVRRRAGFDGDVQIVIADYVFVQGSRCVTVTVDPQPVNYFLMMRSGIDELLQSLEIIGDDGTRFRGQVVDCDQVGLNGEVWAPSK